MQPVAEEPVDPQPAVYGPEDEDVARPVEPRRSYLDALAVRQARGHAAAPDRHLDRPLARQGAESGKDLGRVRDSGAHGGIVKVKGESFRRGP